ncbi:MAG: hypothetical protein OZ921_13820 [Sorangiineae bacterium]|nr:hypothetical protein [Polyangiaceae bacterium]MEB2323585.1 hypothetical protein [Sorangiineae bacterium]
MKVAWWLVVLVNSTVTACSGGDAASPALDSARADFATRCKAAYESSCTKGFACQSFFMTSRYNSVRHCEDELYRQVDQRAAAFTDSADAADCARACDTMKSDVEALACDQFDDATFNRYHCGS